ncbi:Bax inhibitor-1/YccA family protein [Oceanivirga salmonicida]|uniref:Bax inhibitor-1/YccA family protein n=1 Tax=Oceanivirga salmonicida TaxID=1769291 RepID=UPI00082F5315|nr:Bax inhibitor-1/YccA family protein [Oceanivirga salmonicida]
MYYDIEYGNTSVSEIVSEKMKVMFLILTTALLVTLGIVIMITQNDDFIILAAESFQALIFLELGIAFALSFMAYRANKVLLLVFLYIYAILTGATLSVFTLIFTPASVIGVLSGTVALFTVLTVYGYVSKIDMSNYRTLLFVGLITLIIVTIINIFLRSSVLDTLISFAGVAIFIIYTVYDTNVIKNNIMVLAHNGETEIIDRIAIIGAFSLYLDFINLFIYLLRLFGKKK